MYVTPVHGFLHEALRGIRGRLETAKDHHAFPIAGPQVEVDQFWDRDDVVIQEQQHFSSSLRNAKVSGCRRASRGLDEPPKREGEGAAFQQRLRLSAGSIQHDDNLQVAGREGLTTQALKHAGQSLGALVGGDDDADERGCSHPGTDLLKSLILSFSQGSFSTQSYDFEEAAAKVCQSLCNAQVEINHWPRLVRDRPQPADTVIAVTKSLTLLASRGKLGAFRGDDGFCRVGGN
jgi:hypothetical protein